MRRFILMLVCLGALACGSGNSAQGTLGGQRYDDGEALYAVVPSNAGATGELGIVMLSSTQNTCQALADGTFYQQSGWAFGFIANRPQDGAAFFDEGAYALEATDVIAAQLASAAPRPQRLGHARAYAFDDTCTASDDSPYAITQGTMVISALHPGSDLEVGFDVSQDAQEHLTGHMRAHFCQALGALFDDASTPGSSESPKGGACQRP